MINLTKSERKLLRFLKNRRNWNLPTAEEMRKYMGYRSRSYAHRLFKSLKKKGVIRKLLNGENLDL